MAPHLGLTILIKMDIRRISDGKAVQLASEHEKGFVDDDEDAVEYYVSH